MDNDGLTKTRVERVRDKIKLIDYEHKIGSSPMIGQISDEEARRSYRDLLAVLPSIPEITKEEIELLTKEINKKLNKVGVYVHPSYNSDVITDYDGVVKAIEKIHHEHRYDAGAMFGTLTEMEAINAYNILITILPEIESLTDEQRNDLSAQIRVKIGQTSIVEEEKKAEREAEKAEFDKAFEEAKERFKKLSIFQKIRLNLKGKNPEQLETEFMNVNDVNGLYRR